MIEKVRVCHKHGAPIIEDPHNDRMRCEKGCHGLLRFKVITLPDRKLVADVTACMHRGRSSHHACPICGRAPTEGPKPRNGYEREIADAETSVAKWAPAWA